MSYYKENKRLIGEFVRNKVKEYRKLNNLTQTDIAIKLGMSRTNYINIENGSGYFSIVQIYLLSEIFNIYVSDLLPPRGMFQTIEEEILVPTKVKRIIINN